jgi:hypothetical protein
MGMSGRDPCDGFSERNELLFRDYLRDHPDLVHEYGELKRGLSEELVRILKVIRVPRLPLSSTLWTDHVKNEGFLSRMYGKNNHLHRFPAPGKIK